MTETSDRPPTRRPRFGLILCGLLGGCIGAGAARLFALLSPEIAYACIVAGVVIGLVLADRLPEMLRSLGHLHVGIGDLFGFLLFVGGVALYVWLVDTTLAMGMGGSWWMARGRDESVIVTWILLALSLPLAYMLARLLHRARFREVNIDVFAQVSLVHVALAGILSGLLAIVLLETVVAEFFWLRDRIPLLGILAAMLLVGTGGAFVLPVASHETRRLFGWVTSRRRSPVVAGDGVAGDGAAGDAALGDAVPAT